MSQSPSSPGIALLPPSFEPWRGRAWGHSVAVLMSGGVDSSMAALFLKEAGWDVVGFTMKIPTAEACAHPTPCCGADAARVCRDLGVPHYFLDVGDAFRTHVIEPFQRAYREGRTPSPCVDCNTALKFGLVWDFIEANFGIERLATGHYAQLVQRGDGWRLTRAAVRGRDQSYFIYGVPRRRLAKLMLPLGDWCKDAVRAVATVMGLPVAEKADSMELCFAGEGNYRRALADAASPGPILDTAGRAVGRHLGIENFTVGQRRGLRVALGEPAYVCRVCPADSSVTIGGREDASWASVAAEAVHALQPERLRPGTRLLGKIRSHGDPEPCTVVDATGAAVAVEFDVPQFAPAPGQHLVLYDDDGSIVAGGTIAAERGVCHVTPEQARQCAART